jgi:4-hydroxy-tetrahydrodipicolinate reductase
MKLLIIGYGNMGKEIESLALERGHQIAGIVDSSDALKSWVGSADVAVEFTTPEAALHNIKWCIARQMPVVCGTTGWLHHFASISSQCIAAGGALFYASNFSLGVNLFFKLNAMLATLMQTAPNYEAVLEEIHHIHKKDTPSGTAITLAKALVKHHPAYTTWTSGATGEKGVLPVLSQRIDAVPGTHSLRYESPEDTIEIRHTAHSRKGFAMGVLQAVEWLPGRKGVFGMDDLLSIEDIALKSKL